MDEEEARDAVDEQKESYASQTQPEVSNLVKGIFGSDDEDEDEDENVGRKAFNLDDDSDDDDLFASKKPVSRLMKKGKAISSSSSNRSGSLDDLLEDSDEEDVIRNRKKELKSSKKRKHAEKGSGKIKKRSQDRPKRAKTSSSSDIIPSAGAGGADDDRDEYDSDGEVARNEDDERFIDEDEDINADIMREYNAEDQIFDDERPDKYGKTSKKKSGGSSGGSRGGGGGGGGGGTKKDLDPFSETLESMKKKKAVELNELEKNNIVQDLLHKMDAAARKDEEMFHAKQPAVHKLNMLENVKRIVAVKALHNTLLDFDVLAVLRDWIEPKPDRSLPSLTVRTAVYEMLMALPCQTSHLKRHEPGKKTIGMTVLALRRHKAETPANKEMLRKIMERWARPVFNKETDSKALHSGDNAELRECAMQRMSSLQSEEGGAVHGLLSRAASHNDAHARVRMPFTNGFLFTVRPESKSIEKTDVLERTMGQSRVKLLKKMKDTRPSASGKKQNPRAMDMATTGRNKPNCG